MLSQILVNALVESSLTALTALGFALIYTTTRIFHIAHGAAYTVGAYACFAALVLWGIALPVAIVVGVAAAALFGAVVEWSVYSPLVARQAPPLVGLLSSLGTYIVAVNVVALIFGSENKTFVSGQSNTLVFGGIAITSAQLLQVGVSVAAVAVVLWTLVVTSFGTTVRAVRDNAALAAITGTNVALVRVAIMALGSAMTGLAAVLAAIDVGTDPHAGMPAFLVASVAMILGGTRTLVGPLFGALIMAVFRSLVVWTISAQWADAVTFAALVLILVVRPEGLMPEVVRVEEEA